MAYSKIEQRTEQIVQSIVKDIGYILYHIAYEKEGPYWFLRVYVDRDGGVSVDDCEKISKQLSAILDQEDFIKTNYFLEVSSPGIERELTQDWHFEKYKGNRIIVKTHKKKYEGTLVSFDGDQLVLDEPAQTVLKKDIKKVRLNPMLEI